MQYIANTLRKTILIRSKEFHIYILTVQYMQLKLKAEKVAQKNAKAYTHLTAFWSKGNLVATSVHYGILIFPWWMLMMPWCQVQK